MAVTDSAAATVSAVPAFLAVRTTGTTSMTNQDVGGARAITAEFASDCPLGCAPGGAQPASPLMRAIGRTAYGICKRWLFPPAVTAFKELAERLAAYRSE